MSSETPPPFDGHDDELHLPDTFAGDSENTVMPQGFGVIPNNETGDRVRDLLRHYSSLLGGMTEQELWDHLMQYSHNFAQAHPHFEDGDVYRILPHACRALGRRLRNKRMELQKAGAPFTTMQSIAQSLSSGDAQPVDALIHSLARAEQDVRSQAVAENHAREVPRHIQGVCVGCRKLVREVLRYLRIK